MMPRSRIYRNPRARRGIATLEFAMSLPVLLALFVTIVWLGASLIGQAEVSVAARHNTWKERSQVAQGSGNPLVFAADTPIKRNAETTVDISPIFAGMAPPKSNAAILGGSWDHRQINLNSQPNWDLYAKVGGTSVNLTLQDALGSLFELGDIDVEASDILSGLITLGVGGDSLKNLGSIKDALPL
jgi:hypothetical protein